MDVRGRQSAMPKARQLNTRLESGIQSQLKVLNPSDVDIPVSSAYALLADDLDPSHPKKDGAKSIDYFDFD